MFEKTKEVLWLFYHGLILMVVIFLLIIFIMNFEQGARLEARQIILDEQMIMTINAMASGMKDIRNFVGMEIREKNPPFRLKKGEKYYIQIMPVPSAIGEGVSD